MKRIALGLIVLFVFSSTAYAHPPSDIKITYDPNARTVTAQILHKVGNPAGHYIAKVDVSLNNVEILEHRISRQDTTEGQTVMYFIPDAKAGDTLSIEAYCSISGKLLKSIKIK